MERPVLTAMKVKLEHCEHIRTLSNFIVDKFRNSHDAFISTEIPSDCCRIDVHTYDVVSLTSVLKSVISPEDFKLLTFVLKDKSSRARFVKR